MTTDAGLLPSKFLYHYTTAEAAFEHILPSRRLRLSSYSLMRDPQENKEWRISGSFFVPDDVAKDDPGHPENEFARFYSLANAIKASAKLLSFTIDADDFDEESEAFGRGWARPRMWDQYSERYRGVCLVFEREKLIRGIVESLQEQDLNLPYYKPVRYSQSGSGSGFTFNPGSVQSEVDEDYVAKFVEDHHESLFFSKTSDWATEHEFRFVMTSFVERDHEFVNFGDSLEAVVVSEKFPPWQRAGAIQLCEQVDARPLRLDWSMGKPILVTLSNLPEIPDSEDS